MAKANSPCKDCERRYQGCHGQCEDYQTWKAAWDAERNERHKEKEKETMLGDYYVESVRRTVRKIGGQR